MVSKSPLSLPLVVLAGGAILVALASAQTSSGQASSGQRNPKAPRAPRRFLPDAPRPGADGWRATTATTPTALAARVDGTLNKLRYTITTGEIYFNIPAGDGQGVTRSVLQSPNDFDFEYNWISNSGKDHFLKQIYRASKGGVKKLAAKGWVPVGSPSKLANAATAPLEDFLLGFDRFVIYAFVGGKPFSSLVKSANAKGWKVFAESRRTSTSNDQRLQLASPDGKRRYVIVVDVRRGLPKQIYTQDTRASIPTRTYWSSNWATKSTPLTAEERKSYTPATVASGAPK